MPQNLSANGWLRTAKANGTGHIINGKCLADLPFVRDNRPDLSRVPEKGIRPAGTFFDHFTDEDEQVTWAYASEDFQTLGYKRYDASLPEGSANSLRL
jgi:hypothetical protein